MPNNQSNGDRKLIDRDREVDQILEESRYLLDQEQMELTAQKYRVKQPVAEIFSNADKKPRLENSNPLEVDKEKAVNENGLSAVDSSFCVLTGWSRPASTQGRQAYRRPAPRRHRRVFRRRTTGQFGQNRRPFRGWASCRWF